MAFLRAAAILLALTAAAPAAATQSPERSDESLIRPNDVSTAQMEDIQKSLGAAGYPVQRTGRFDEQTRDAISRFQRANGLDATGELDARTAHALGFDKRALEMELAEHGT
jgi:peptidoglycan hydrolase-like protein with peptidoglycan-binding domain